MEIKRVYIEQFGKLRKKEFLFKPGINIIYGKNESGKTTLVQFFLTMFYGHRTSKKFNVDPREKYIPFGHEFAYGQISITEKDQSFLIQRKIGQKRKDDVYRSFHEETLDQAKFEEHLGKELFDLELEQFLKTLFVSQSGLRFQREKDESLNTKLTNLLETGDEDISYSKAMAIIDDEMKKIKTNRKTGQLDQLYMKLNERYKSLEEAKESKEEQKQLSRQLNEKIKAHASVEEQLRDLKKIKGKVHLYEVKDQVFKIQENLEQIEAVKSQQKVSRDPLMSEMLSKMKEENEKTKGLQEEISDLKENSHGLKRQLDALKLDLADYDGFLDLPENTLVKLVKNQGEVNLILEKLKAYDKENTIHPMVIEKRDELSSLLHKYETTLKSLKHMERRTLYFLVMIVLGALFLTQVFVLRQGVYSLITFMLFVVVGFSGIKLKRFWRIYLLKRVDKFEEKIDVLAKAMAMGPMEVIKSKRIVDALPNKGEKEKLTASYHKHLEEIENILQKTRTKTIDDFISQEKMFKELLSKNQVLQHELEKINLVIEDKTKERDAKQENLIKRLKVEEYDEKTDEIDFFLERLTLKEEREYNLLQEEESLRYTLKTLIGDRNFDEVKEELTALQRLGLHKENKLENLEDKENELEIEHQRLILSIDELSAKKLTVLKEEPLRIEDEISTMLEEESRLKRRYLVLETTRELMESSYRELRSQYIGALNEKVTLTFNAMTNTRRNIKVAEYFSMKYEENREIYIDTYLSKGALDQLYFALRLAMIDLIFSGKKVPIFLDEPFVSYDEERLKNTLDYLHQKEDQYQIFIFTCHKREVNLLKKYGHVVDME